MSLSELCWLSTAAYALHVLEEFAFNWRDWARGVLHLPVDWNAFYVTNAVVIVLGIVSAEIAPAAHVVALGFPALMLINATVFHAAPVLWTKDRFSPGLFTAMLLFYPLGPVCFRVANAQSGLTAIAIAEAFLLGALFMAMPIVFLKLAGHRYFLQDPGSR
ncbi:MAG TPA: HXXEE domain-containing protein [Acidobacteriaceae bacterium]